MVPWRSRSSDRFFLYFGISFFTALQMGKHLERHRRCWRENRIVLIIIATVQSALNSSLLQLCALLLHMHASDSGLCNIKLVPVQQNKHWMSLSGLRRWRDCCIHAKQIVHCFCKGTSHLKNSQQCLEVRWNVRVSPIHWKWQVSNTYFMNNYSCQC